MYSLLGGATLFWILLPALELSALLPTADSAVVAPSKMFEFAYETRDEDGNVKMHREVQNHMGHRIGTYGYRNMNGIFRFVDYVADNHGYRATIRTNEPGTSNQLGPHVTVHASAPPAGTVVENSFSSSAVELPQVPIMPMVHEMDAVRSHARRRHQLQTAMIFPPPPVIRPPRYKPRATRLAESNFIAPAFRKSRS